MNSTASKIVLIFALAFGTVTVSVPNAEAAPSLRAAAMASANTQKGAKYVYGAEGGYSKGYDCSGLIKWAYKQHGKTLPRTAQQQYNAIRRISAGSRQPGDLVFIHDARGHVYHVGILSRIYKGHGYLLNANYGRTTAHKVGEWPLSYYTSGSPYATYARP